MTKIVTALAESCLSGLAVQYRWCLLIPYLVFLVGLVVVEEHAFPLCIHVILTGFLSMEVMVIDDCGYILTDLPLRGF